MPDHLFEAHLETAISDAELLADQERLDTVFVHIVRETGGSTSGPA